MKFYLLTLSIALSFVHGSSSDKLALRRRLSYEKVAGYAPGSQVTDHCAIDRDQKAIEAELGKSTNESFQNALQIYQQGGNSKSYAEISLIATLDGPLAKGAEIFGRTTDGLEVSGKAYQAYQGGEQKIKVQYSTSDIQADYVNCQVGGLVMDINKAGCLEPNGTVTMNGKQYAYAYDIDSENKNGRTIAGFSTQAREKMFDGCKGCPYRDFKYFYDYYGETDYANQWVTAALNGETTNFKKGNADFGQYSFKGRAECAKKGTAYMSVFMYIIREFEDALDDCVSGCINCNDDPVHAWDEGVCFYTGSIEGQDGRTEDGKLLHQLADKRCQDYKTCGVEGNELDGTAAINYELFDLFSLAAFQLSSGNCPGARETTKLVVDLMYVPLIQGTLRYAYKVDKLQGGEKEMAEGAVFAAAVLPRIHAANKDAATTIYNNMRVGASSTNFKDVKAAFQSVYRDLGITCTDVGGLWNDAEKNYYEGMEPCPDASNTAVIIEEDETLAIILGSVFGALFGIVLAGICCMRRKEKQGKPVFSPYLSENTTKKDPEFVEVDFASSKPAKFS